MNALAVPSINALHDDINRAPYLYYQDVIANLHPPRNVGIILVAHSYETVFALAKSVSTMGNLRGIILKNSTNDRFPEVGEELTRACFPVLDITKDQVMRNSNAVIKQIERAVPHNERFVVMDHGGYFAYDSDLFKHFPNDQLIGVSEHTLNGEERYRKIRLNDRPIVSVGQSLLKLPSDQASADAIVHASESFLQIGGMSLTNPMSRVSIIGFGRLGSRIGQQLSSKDVSRVMVNDINASKLAGMRGHTYAAKTALCRNSDIIFCATGNHALTPADYAQLKNNTIIFTVTSPDDELGLPQLIKDKVLIPVAEKKRGDTYMYRVAATGNLIILPFNGESPNTSSPYGIPGPFIHQTYAAHIAATIDVMNGNMPAGLHPIRPELEEMVSQLWIKHFGQPDGAEAQQQTRRRKRNTSLDNRAISSPGPSFGATSVA